jgi:hypothetical protein
MHVEETVSNQHLSEFRKASLTWLACSEFDPCRVIWISFVLNWNPKGRALFHIGTTGYAKLVR